VRWGGEEGESLQNTVGGVDVWTRTSCMVRGAESRRAFGVLVPYPRARRLRRGWSWTRWKTWRKCVLVLIEGEGERGEGGCLA
jgi:hypothetical protein